MKSLLFNLLQVCVLLVYKPSLAAHQHGIIAKMPITFSQGEPATVININNKEIPLLLDTGASKMEIVLSPYALKNIPVTYTGAIHCVRSAIGRTCMKKFIIPEVKLGSLIMRDVPGEEVREMWGESTPGFIITEASRNGVLGLGFMKRFNVLLDYQNHQITYLTQHTYPASVDLKKCHAVKSFFDKGITADFVFHHKKNEMVLDTGSNLSIIKSGDRGNLIPCDKEHVNDIKNCRIEKMALFPDQAPERFYVEADLKVPFDGIIGSEYIMNHRIFIDSYNQVVFYC